MRVFLCPRTGVTRTRLFVGKILVPPCPVAVAAILSLQLTGASSNLIICCILRLFVKGYKDDTPCHHSHIIQEQERCLDVISTHVKHANCISDQVYPRQPPCYKGTKRSAVWERSDTSVSEEKRIKRHQTISRLLSILVSVQATLVSVQWLRCKKKKNSTGRGKTVLKHYIKNVL